VLRTPHFGSRGALPGPFLPLSFSTAEWCSEEFVVGSHSAHFSLPICASIHHILISGVESLGSFKYRFISSANYNNSFLHFLFVFLLFLSLALFTLAKNSNTLLNKREESRHSSLLIFRGNAFSFYHFSTVLPVPFIVLRYVTFISSFFRAFIMKKC
jgi:hypothetical protein